MDGASFARNMGHSGFLISGLQQAWYQANANCGGVFQPPEPILQSNASMLGAHASPAATKVAGTAVIYSQ